MRVVVLGGGYAGLLVARSLQAELPDDAELVVVDETGEHLIQHEVHRVIRNPDFADVLTIPLADLLPEATVRTATVTGIDPDDGVIELGDDTLNYDVAAVCLGATTTDHGIPGVTEYGHPLKSVADATAIREAALEDFESGGSIVVGGAGLSGVQAAGELAALAREHGVTDRVNVELVEQEPRIAPAFPTRFQDVVQDRLTDRGVQIRTDTTVSAVTEDSITTDAQGDIGADTLVWTGGIEGSAALGGERPSVRADLRWAPNTFVAGDAGRIVDVDGERVPATAQAAVRAATVCAANVLSSLDVEYQSLDRFEFDNLGWLVSIGDDAVAQVGPSILTGSPARAMKAMVGLRYLTSAGATREAFRVVRAEFYD